MAPHVCSSKKLDSGKKVQGDATVVKDPKFAGVRVRSRGGPPEKFSEVVPNSLFPKELLQKWRDERSCLVATIAEKS